LRGAFIDPLGNPLQIRHLDDEGRRLFTGSTLLEWQQHRATLGDAGPDRPSTHLGAPHRCRRRHRDLEETALVVANGETRFDEQAAVFRCQSAITRFFDVGDQHGLRNEADDVDGERAWLASGDRPQTKRDHRR